MAQHDSTAQDMTAKTPSEWLELATSRAEDVIGHLQDSGWWPVLLVALAALVLLRISRPAPARAEPEPQEAPGRSEATVSRLGYHERHMPDNVICRWKIDEAETRGRGRAKLDRWRCITCGQDAMTAGGVPPDECKRHLKNGG